MTAVQSKLYTDDVSLLVVLIDTNPLFWKSINSTLPFNKFLSHVLAFLNSVLLLNQLNQVVVIATGYNSCEYIFDSSTSQHQNLRAEHLLLKLEEFADKDESLCSEDLFNGPGFSLLSGSLSMALCYIQKVFRSGSLHPQPRILCMHGSPDGPGQYVAVMNSIFSAQRSMVPIDSCAIGAQHSAFLQQASYITGGVYLKPPHLDGLLQHLLTWYRTNWSKLPPESREIAKHCQESWSCAIKGQTGQSLSEGGFSCKTVFVTDLHSRRFLRLPKPAGVDFRASCFCHKNTIDMGYICSVCLSIFCKHQKKCTTCGSIFGQSQTQNSSTPDRKRKTPMDL